MAKQRKISRVGIDIGTDSVKVCRLINGPQGIEVTNIGRVEIYPENVAANLANDVEEKINTASIESAPAPMQKREKPEAEDKEKTAEKRKKLIDAVRKVMADADIKDKEVVSAVSGQSVIVRYIEIPHMTQEELAGAIRFEAEQYIPFEIDNVEMDYQILEEKMPHSPEKMRVLLVAAKKDLVKEHFSLLEEAGLKPIAFDVDAFAMINAFEKIKSVSKEECAAVINIGHNLTSINILRGGIPYFTRDVFLAGRDITGSLAKRFGLEFSQAEKLKRDKGNVLQGDTFNKALGMGLEDLVGEIRLSFDYYENQALEKNISCVYLTGGTSLLPQLDKFLSDTIGMRVEVWNPIKDLEANDVIKQWESVGPALTISIGLALHSEK